HLPSLVLCILCLLPLILYTTLYLLPTPPTAAPYPLSLHDALPISRLRSRARAKFGEFADSMLFTPDGLEQATRLPVAALHAQRFRRAGISSVADLGCGIGGDAMALAGLGLDVHAVDRDPVTVAVAIVNLRPFPGS